jgi:hypothetical protein
VFEALGYYAESQGLDTRNSLIAVRAVAHHTGQAWHFRHPTAVILALELDRKNHGSTVTSGPLSNNRLEPSHYPTRAIKSPRCAAQAEALDR